MRLTIRLPDDLTQQVAAICEQRELTMAAMVREALGAYVGEGSRPAPRLPWREPTPQMPHTLDECAARLVAHSPPEIQQRLTADMARTGLSLRNQLLGILYGWATRQWMA